MLRQDPNRENPLEVPLVLLYAADSPIADALAIVAEHIAALPAEVHSSFDKHFDAGLVESLQDLANGLSKLRVNILPSKDEVSILTCPHQVLRELASGLRTVAEHEPISLDVIGLIEEDADQLETAASELLPGVEAAAVTIWFDRQMKDPSSPIHEDKSGSPPPPSP